MGTNTRFKLIPIEQDVKMVPVAMLAGGGIGEVKMFPDKASIVCSFCKVE